MSWARLLLSVVLCTAACKSKSDPGKGGSDDADGSAESGGDPDPTGANAVPQVQGAPLGGQFVEGAAVSFGLRAGPTVAFLQSLPLPSDVARDVAELSQVLGEDVRVGDPLARWKIPANGAVSFSLFRPIDGALADAEKTLRDRPGWLGAKSAAIAVPDTAVAVDEPEPPPPVDKTVAVEKPPAEIASDDPPPLEEPTTAQPPDSEPPPIAEPPVPAKPDPKRIAFDAKIATIALHSRVHIPSSQPSAITADIRRIEPKGSARPRRECARLTGTALCNAGHDMTVILREGADGLTLDVLYYPTADGETHVDARLAIAQQAIAMPSTLPAPMAPLLGDATAFVDGEATARALAVGQLENAVDSLSWEFDDSSRYARRMAALRELRTEPVFSGMTGEMSVTAERLVARARWVPVESQRAAVKRTLLGRAPRDPVPITSTLCDGALMCARTRSLPSLDGLADMATGPFGSLERLDDAIDDGDEEGLLVVFLQNWPRALGALARAPEAPELDPGERMIAKSVKNIVGHLEGFGGSIRNLSINRGRVSMDYAAYVRLPAGDIAAIRGLLAMAEQKLAPATINGVDGNVEMLRLPDSELPVSLFAWTQEGQATGAMVVADGGDRLAWLAGLPTQANEAPSAYFEITDLWRLFSSEQGVARELGVASGWLGRRYFRVQLDVPEGVPTLRAVLAKTPG